MRRRAVGLRGFVYFVGTHTRSTVPLGRSAAALGAILEGPQILFISKITMTTEGLHPRLDVLDLRLGLSREAGDQPDRGGESTAGQDGRESDPGIAHSGWFPFGGVVDAYRVS